MTSAEQQNWGILRDIQEMGPNLWWISCGGNPKDNGVKIEDLGKSKVSRKNLEKTQYLAIPGKWEETLRELPGLLTRRLPHSRSYPVSSEWSALGFALSINPWEHAPDTMVDLSQSFLDLCLRGEKCRILPTAGCPECVYCRADHSWAPGRGLSLFQVGSWNHSPQSYQNNLLPLPGHFLH